MAAILFSVPTIYFGLRNQSLDRKLSALVICGNCYIFRANDAFYTKSPEANLDALVIFGTHFIFRANDTFWTKKLMSRNEREHTRHFGSHCIIRA